MAAGTGILEWSPGFSTLESYHEDMRLIAALVVGILLLPLGGALAVATEAQPDLPGDRADIVAQGLMSPF